jgi:hypothetical protein
MMAPAAIADAKEVRRDRLVSCGRAKGASPNREQPLRGDGLNRPSSPILSKKSGDGDLRTLQSKHGPDVEEERIVGVSASSHAVDVIDRTVELGPARVLQADTKIEPRPKRRPTMTKRQVGDFEYPPGAIWAAARVP